MSSPAQARAARRRHLQQRQTLIFGTLITAMLVIGLAAGAVWAGILPSPLSVPISEPETTESGDAGPCPPEGATYVPLTEISANVLNGTSRAGLAAETSAELGERGIAVGRQDNAESPFAGVVRIVSGPSGLAAAYTAGVLFTDARIDVDSRTDETVDVILGSSYEALRPADEIDIDPDIPIPVPRGCEPLATAEPTEPTDEPSPSEE